MSDAAPEERGGVKVKYSPPSWSAVPKFKCTLDMIVNGVVRRTFDLDAKPFYLVGACAVTAGSVQRL